MPICSKCNIDKPESEFYKNNKHYRSGFSYDCKPCHKIYYVNNYDRLQKQNRTKRLNDPIKYMLYNAKQRAKKKGVAFSIDITKLHVPTHCPVFGVELIYGGTGKTEKGYGAYENAASLDRINPTKGYVDDNVIIICWEANRAKALLTPEKLRLLSEYYNRIG